MSLVIVGSIGLDNIETPSGKVTNVIGGSASYASIVAQNFVDTKLVGVVGTDFSNENLQVFKDRNISLEGLEIVAGKTFRWGGKYNDLNKAETLFTDLNVFADFNPKIPESYLPSKYLFLGNIHPDLQLNVLNQFSKAEVTACDTMNFWITGAKKKLIQVIKKVDILFINEDEIKSLTEVENVYDASETILKLGPKFVVVKRGEYGAFVYGKDLIFNAPVYPVRKVVDPTGAGDSFAGGFMGFVSKMDNLDNDIIKKAMFYGTVTASINVENVSIDNVKKMTLNEIEKRYEDLLKITQI